MLFAVVFITLLLPPLFKFRQTGYTDRKAKNEKIHKQVAKRD
ncbi:hypothetical protein CUZ96_0462 [Enterococcus lactis]|uniref:Uncharacterized protein n=1 Tax=Enterococcus faecium 505 TaxID=1134806 RepID=J6YX71_ENTFC|nr:hypothetical protein HMPREF1348_01585 [Enterococcus faecium 505]MBL5004860.1 hypothetical protein [Enterococcus lactis]MBL5010799.1 hypothetical protein [Enterococcus lactis]